MRFAKARAAHALLVLSTLILGAAVIAPQRADSAPQDPYAALNKQFDDEIYDLFDTHCMKCHSGSQPAAGIDFAKYENAQAVAQDANTFQKVILNIRSQVMPPTKETPTLAEREKMVDWINRALSKNGTADIPGRVTIRRLNKNEYNNTIHDLLYIDGDFSKDFPSDDVGYGFDNIGDVLTLTPLHIDMYLRAARTITEKAIAVPQPKERFADLAQGRLGANGSFTNEGDVGMFSNGNYEIDFENTAPGEYELEVELSASATKVGPAESSVFINRQLAQTIQVKSEQRTTYRLPVVVSNSKTTVAISFNNDFYNPNDPDPAKRDRNLVIHGVALKGPTGTGNELSESHRRLLFVQPSATKNHLAAAREILDRFASRAYRRPITSDESNRIMKIYELVRKNGDNFEQGIRVAMQGVLVNPNFLFRVELDSTSGPRELTGTELASRLSYFLWNSIPDDTLAKLGESNQLKDPKILEAQVTRMLADPKSKRFSEDFAIQWLQIGRIEEHIADPRQFPTFNDQMKSDMTEEITLFFQDMLANNRPVTEFIDSKFTFLNHRLAQHYKIPGDFDEIFRRVDVSAQHRGGILGMGALLTVTSNPNRTSPVKRGKFVMEQILGTPPPPPPPNVGVLNDNQPFARSTRMRERLEKHRSDPSCASCHRPLDAFGFTLENFDPVGVYRDREGSFAIDNVGELPGNVKIVGVDDLKSNLISRQDDFNRTLTEKLLTYALGRGLTPTDSVRIEELNKRAAKTGLTLPAIIKEIVLSDSFRQRPAKQSSTN